MVQRTWRKPGPWADPRILAVPEKTAAGEGGAQRRWRCRDKLCQLAGRAGVLWGPAPVRERGRGGRPGQKATSHGDVFTTEASANAAGNKAQGRATPRPASQRLWGQRPDPGPSHGFPPTRAAPTCVLATGGQASMDVPPQSWRCWE